MAKKDKTNGTSTTKDEGLSTPVYRAEMEIQGIAPYAQSRRLREKLSDETWDEYEEKLWRERVHANEDGHVYAPGAAFKKCLAAGASHRGEKIKGRGNLTYKKSFEGGVIVEGDVPLYDDKGQPITKERMVARVIDADANPTSRGKGARVRRIIPHTPTAQWTGTVGMLVLDPQINEKVLRQHAETAGLVVGIGQWRGECNGSNGRFRVKRVTFEKLEL